MVLSKNNSVVFYYVTPLSSSLQQESLVEMERKETVDPQVRVFQGCKVTEEALEFLGFLVLLVHLGVQDYLVKMAYQDCLVIW